LLTICHARRALDPPITPSSGTSVDSTTLRDEFPLFCRGGRTVPQVVPLESGVACLLIAGLALPASTRTTPRRRDTVEERKTRRHPRARLLGQRDETLNIRDIVGVTVEQDEAHGEQSPHREREEQAGRQSEPHRGLSREKRHVTISFSIWRVWWVIAMTRRDGGM
jgi:hypothetical protein